MAEERVHELKIWPAEFADVIDGRKTFEVRRNDRDFSVGDALLLRCWIPAPDWSPTNNVGRYTGDSTRVRVTYVFTDGPEFGVGNGYVVMSIVPATPAPAPTAPAQPRKPEDWIGVPDSERGIIRCEACAFGWGIEHVDDNDVATYTCPECGAIRQEDGSWVVPLKTESAPTPPTPTGGAQPEDPLPIRAEYTGALAQVIRSEWYRDGRRIEGDLSPEEAVRLAGVVLDAIGGDLFEVLSRARRLVAAWHRSEVIPNELVLSLDEACRAPLQRAVEDMRRERLDGAAHQPEARRKTSVVLTKTQADICFRYMRHPLQDAEHILRLAPNVHDPYTNAARALVAIGKLLQGGQGRA